MPFGRLVIWLFFFNTFQSKEGVMQLTILSHSIKSERMLSRVEASKFMLKIVLTFEWIIAISARENYRNAGDYLILDSCSDEYIALHLV